jgi:hypothetical protein
VDRAPTAPLLFGLAALTLSLVACGQRSPERAEVSAAIAQAVHNRTGDTLDLAQVAPFAWTRVCLIPRTRQWSRRMQWSAFGGAARRSTCRH